jgi:DNA-binding HxlR family transcriptional regulator
MSGMKGVPDVLLALDGKELNFSGIKKKVSISNAWLHEVFFHLSFPL